MQSLRRQTWLFLILGVTVALGVAGARSVLAEGAPVGPKEEMKPLVPLADLSKLAAIYAAPIDAPDGRYLGSAIGREDPVTVAVTIANRRIVKVEVLQHGDTPVLSDAAWELVPQAIVEAQSTKVDAVSGATMSSEGVINAVRAALAAALSAKK
ncbi:MAG: FMN-binding protein [Betaproteobacteria bacterium]